MPGGVTERVRERNYEMLLDGLNPILWRRVRASVSPNARIGEVGSAERLLWRSTTAGLLPRLIDDRLEGLLFVGDRKLDPTSS